MRTPFIPVCLLLVFAACASRASRSEPNWRPEREWNVGFLIVDGVYNTELTAPLDVFHHTVFHTERGMRVFTVAPTDQPVTTFEGLRLLPDHTFEDAPAIDVLVVPSAEHSMDTDLKDRRMIDWVRTTAAGAQYVVSLCDGAFVLAEAGLLDGRQATTFPADRQKLRERYPQVNVLDGVSFVHDGPLITSAGGALSFDPAMYLSELLYGTKAARGIGRGLCIDWDRTRVKHRIAPVTGDATP